MSLKRFWKRFSCSGIQMIKLSQRVFCSQCLERSWRTESSSRGSFGGCAGWMQATEVVGEGYKETSEALEKSLKIIWENAEVLNGSRVRHMLLWLQNECLIFNWQPIRMWLSWCHGVPDDGLWDEDPAEIRRGSWRGWRGRWRAGDERGKKIIRSRQPITMLTEIMISSHLGVRMGQSDASSWDHWDVIWQQTNHIILIMWRW